MNIVDTLSTKRLCFTVTSGRSGTKLLAELLRGGAGICAEHEPAPRFNYVLRSILDCPEAARWWLETEKLPAMAERVGAETAYAETSHLTCKGFIEPLLELGLRPVLLFVARPARDVARSLFKIGAIPERTPSGRLVLIGPAHSPFLRVADWENWTDYQLCYWYAREIERRQGYYRKLASRVGLEWFDCSFGHRRLGQVRRAQRIRVGIHSRHQPGCVSCDPPAKSESARGVTQRISRTRPSRRSRCAGARGRRPDCGDRLTPA